MKTEITKNIDIASNEIVKGRIVAIPTETVYGLGADALNPLAVLNIYIIKKRPTFNPLIVHIHSIKDIEKYAENIPDEVYKIAEIYSPGPITYVLKKKKLVPDLVTAGNISVALRIPSHHHMREVIKKSGKAIAAPSANMFGRISPTSAEEVFKELNGKIRFILDGGKCTIGIESTVISFLNNKITLLRPGFITKEDLEKLLNQNIESEVVYDESNLLSPGMIKSHYAPSNPLYLTDNIDYFKGMIGVGIIDWKTMNSMNDIALNLFSTLRNYDEKDYDFLVCEKVESTGLGIAINDRLEKASTGSVVINNDKITFIKK